MATSATTAAATRKLGLTVAAVAPSPTPEGVLQATIDAMKDVSFDGVTGKVAFDDLAVVTVELHLEIRRAHFSANYLRVVLTVQKETGHIARIDRLDHDGDAVPLRGLGGIGEILQIHLAMPRARLIRADQTGHHMQLAIAEHTRVIERGFDAAAKFVFAARQRCNAAFACRPIAGRRIEERLIQTVRLEPRLDVAGTKIIGKQKLHGLEAVFRRSGETVEKRVLVVHHGQVGGEARHGGNSLVTVWIGAEAFNERERRDRRNGRLPARAEHLPKFFKRRLVERRGAWVGHQPETRGLFELFKRIRCMRH